MNKDLCLPQQSRSRKGLGGRSEPESLGLESHREREMEYGCQAQRAGQIGRPRVQSWVNRTGMCAE